MITDPSQWEEWEEFFNFKEVNPDLNQLSQELLTFITPERAEKINSITSQRSASLKVVVENIYDRGNINAVMRSMESFGFNFLEQIVQPDTKLKEANRVSQGSDKWIIKRTWNNTTNCIKQLKKEGYKVLVTHLSESSIEVKDLPQNEKYAMFLGNERDGVSKEALEQADHNVLIPMQGFTQSFNISVAAALLIQNFYQHLAFSSIDEKSRDALRLLYILKSMRIHHAQEIMKRYSKNS